MNRTVKMQNLDDIDKQIIRILQKNARMPFTQVAEALAISEGTVRKRTKLLEKNGVIEKFTLKLDPDKLGYGTITLLGMDVDPEFYLKASAELGKMNRVKWVAKCSGDHMLMTEIWTANDEELADIMARIEKIEGVKRLCPAIVHNKQG